jgi:hypothetical protein
LGIFIILTIVFLVLWVRSNNELKKTNTTLQTTLITIGDADRYSTSKHSEADSYYDEKKQTSDTMIKRATEAKNGLEQEISALKSELKVLSRETLIQMSTVPAYENLKSDEVKNELALLKNKQDDLVKSGNAISAKDLSQNKKALENQKKQILRTFNAECSYILDNLTVKNVDTSRTKIQRSFDAVNKIFEVDGVQITQNFLAMKFEELSLIYSYAVKVEEEKEQQRAIREQMVEEEKVRREIEKEKARIEKEEAQFTGEINKLMSYMQKASDDVEKQLYIDKIRDLEEKLKKVSADKENVLQREQNTRAGFVYIISNIGAFGENVYKIGMTRRLEPMDRVKELGDASVPFSFDVHALIFSEDAPALETILHQKFKAGQVNKINPRKEFFRVDLDEIKKIVQNNHNATVKFVDIPDAYEYRESLKIAQQ